jgi:hypothetical protein
MAKTLNHYSQQIKALAPDAVALDRAKQLGDLLLQAKAAVKAAGKLWTDWLQSDCELTTRTAQRFMTIATRWDDPAFTEARSANPQLAIREADKVLAANSARKKAPTTTKPAPVTITAGDAKTCVWGPAEFLAAGDGEEVDAADLFSWWIEQGALPGGAEPYVPIHPHFESTSNRFEDRYLPERIKREMQKLRFAQLNYLISEWLGRFTEEELDQEINGVKLRDTSLGQDAAWKPWTFTREFGDRKGEEVTFYCEIKDIAEMVQGIDAGQVEAYIHGHPDWTGRAGWLTSQLEGEQLFLRVMPKHPKAKAIKAAHKAKRPFKAGTYYWYEGREEKNVTYEAWEA